MSGVSERGGGKISGVGRKEERKKKNGGKTNDGKEG